MIIIDYGVGNLKSIKNMLGKIGYRNVMISSNLDKIKKANALILPGVGHFDYGMQQLRKSGLVEILNKRVLQDNTPILGICLGAQLMTNRSEEGKEAGLGWINADTIKFRRTDMGDYLKIPHMGWSDVYFERKDGICADLPEPSRFYFVHSYHIKCNSNEDIAVTAKYGNLTFTAGFQKENIIGMQFHPEKSHKYGMKLLQNFISL